MSASAASAEATRSSFEDPRLDHVFDLVVTCSAPERPGPEEESKDGVRRSIWPILGGKVIGSRLSGEVLPGGADFPYVRPDGVVVVDALYRFRSADGAIIMLHNKGLAYPGLNGRKRYRLAPEFTAPKGPHDWLNRGLFIATLELDVPAALRQAGPGENDRLIRVFEVA